MTLSDIRQLVSLKLGEQTRFYPSAEIDRSGINPAQRLLCLVYPRLLVQRATLTVNTDNPFIDIRTLQDTSGNTIGNRFRRVSRVVLGNVMADAPVANATTNELHKLRRTTIDALAQRSRDWMRHQGTVQSYWLHGPYWLGLYRRPIAATTITVIYEAVPAPLVNNADVPQVQAVYHRVIAEIATGLLLLKEGNPQGILGLRRIVDALNLQVQQTPTQGTTA